jgi:hypothetical protein
LTNLLPEASCGELVDTVYKEGPRRGEDEFLKIPVGFLRGWPDVTETNIPYPQCLVRRCVPLEASFGTNLLLILFQSDPFLMKATDPFLTGNHQYIGYIKDLMDIVSRHLRVNYTIHLVADGNYGTPRTGDGNSWTGMIGELVTGVGTAP